MFDPYRMVLVNITMFFALLCGILFYRYVYPKKKLNLFYLLVLISLLPLVSLLRQGDYESGDFNLHVYRSISFYNALADGQVIPSWGHGLNATFGYPVFIFNYVLSYYFTALFHFFGFSFIASMKLFFAVCYVASGIFMYLWAKNQFHNKPAAFTTAIFYLFAPYHLLNLHFRATSGETAAFAFLPLILLLIQKLIKRPTALMILILGLSFALSFVAHSAETIFSLLIIVPYFLYELSKIKTQKKKIMLYAVFSGFAGLLLSLFAWLPHVLFHNVTLAGELTITFRPTWELFFTPWRGGFLFQGPKGELGFLLGYTQLFVVVAGLFLLVTKRVDKKIKRDYFFWFILFFVLFFLTTSYSKPIWDYASLLKSAQFSTRLLLHVAFCTSVLAGYLVLVWNKKIFVTCLILLTVGYTILNWGHRRVLPDINDSSLVESLPASTANYEGLARIASPKWVNHDNPWEITIPKKHIEILKGQGEIKSVERNTVKHTYIISAKTPLLIKENTIYFPGWSVQIDGKPVHIQYEKPQYRGIMVFEAPVGLHYLEVSYRDTKYFAWAKKIDIIAYLAIATFFTIFGFKKVLKRWKFLPKAKNEKK